MSNFKAFLPTLFLFVLLNVCFVLFQTWLIQRGFSHSVLVWGNILLFGLSIISFFFQHRAVNASAPQLLVRYFYLSFLIKFMLVAVMALIYVKTADQVNRMSVIACMVLYLVYTFIETSMLLKSGKQKNA